MTTTLRANQQPCQNGLVLEDHSGGFRIKPLRHTEWPSPLEGSVELIKQFVAALGLTEHGAGIEPQHRVHVVAVSANGIPAVRQVLTERWPPDVVGACRRPQLYTLRTREFGP